jgi:hypothetical protein
LIHTWLGEVENLKCFEFYKNIFEVLKIIYDLEDVKFFIAAKGLSCF